jgi:hypothetical protein
MIINQSKDAYKLNWLHRINQKYFQVSLKVRNQTPRFYNCPEKTEERMAFHRYVFYLALKL